MSNYPPNQPPPGGFPPNQPPGGFPPNQPPSGGYPPQPPGGQYQYPGQGAYPGGPPPQPKKSNALLWVVGGCLTLVILGGAGFFAVSYLVYNKAAKVAKQSGFDTELMKKNPTLAAAKMAIAADPDVELVSSDDDKGTLTVRDKKTGEVVTITADQVNQGSLSFKKDGKDAGSFSIKPGDNGSGSMEFKSDQGTAKFGSGITGSQPGWVPSYPGSSIQWDYSMTAKDGQRSASFHFSTNDSVDAIAAFYENALKGAGLTLTTMSSQNTSGTGRVVAGNDNDNHRTCVVTILADGSGNKVEVTFVEKAP